MCEGAGPAGATAAYFIAHAGIDVLLVDQATFPRDKSCGDSICPGVVGVMARMGLLDWVQQEGYAENIAYLLSSPKGYSAHIPYPQDLAPYPNYLIPRKEFDYKLVQQAVASGAVLQEGVRITTFERLSPDRVRLHGKQGETAVSITANLVIAADGSISAFTRKLDMMLGPPDGVALRRYYAGVKGEPGRFELHWERPVLPAYGFIFHLNDGIANVGTGMFRKDLKRLGGSLKKRLDMFVRCSHDPVFGRTMAGVLAGVISPGEMLKPGMVGRLLLG